MTGLGEVGRADHDRPPHRRMPTRRGGGAARRAGSRRRRRRPRAQRRRGRRAPATSESSRQASCLHSVSASSGVSMGAPTGTRLCRGKPMWMRDAVLAASDGSVRAASQPISRAAGRARSASAATRTAPANICGVVRGRLAADQQLAEPAAGDERGDRRRGDDLQRRAAQPGDDQRQGQRPLDLADDLAAGHAEGPGGVHRLAVGTLRSRPPWRSGWAAGPGWPAPRRSAATGAEQQHHQDQQAQAGDRPGGVAQPDDQERPRPVCPIRMPSGMPIDGGDQHGSGGVGEVLQQQDSGCRRRAGPVGRVQQVARRCSCAPSVPGPRAGCRVGSAG